MGNGNIFTNAAWSIATAPFRFVGWVGKKALTIITSTYLIGCLGVGAIQAGFTEANNKATETIDAYNPFADEKPVQERSMDNGFLMNTLDNTLNNLVVLPKMAFDKAAQKFEEIKKDAVTVEESYGPTPTTPE